MRWWVRLLDRVGLDLGLDRVFWLRIGSSPPPALLESTKPTGPLQLRRVVETATAV